MFQKLGQHFLTDPDAIEAIAGSLEFRDGLTVVEIGPGTGVLTACLVQKMRNFSGTRLIAIERDPDLAERLRETYGEEARDVSIVLGDALAVLPGVTENLESFALVGNIPYYITGHILRVVGELPRKPSVIVFTVQLEVAERVTAAPPRMNLLAASVQYWASVRIVHHIPREAFAPPPRVDSAVIRIVPMGDGTVTDVDAYYGFIRAFFKQPRKTIWNNLRVVCESAGIPKERLARSLGEFSLNPENRPQDAPLEALRSIAGQLSIEQI